MSQLRHSERTSVVKTDAASDWKGLSHEHRNTDAVVVGKADSAGLVAEWFHDVSSQAEGFGRDGVEVSQFSLFVDGSQDVELLSADRSVGLPGDVVEGFDQELLVAAGGDGFEPGFELSIFLLVDLDVSVPAGIFFSFAGAAAGAVADGIAFVTQGDSTDVTDLARFLGVEGVITFAGEEHEEVFVTKIVQVCQTKLLVAGAFPFGAVDTVSVDQFAVDRFRIFVIRNHSRDIPPETMSQMAAGNLLDKSGDRCCDATITRVFVLDLVAC